MGLCPKPRWGLEAPDPHLKPVQSMRLKTRLVDALSYKLKRVYKQVLRTTVLSGVQGQSPWPCLENRVSKPSVNISPTCTSCAVT